MPGMLFRERQPPSMRSQRFVIEKSNQLRNRKYVPGTTDPGLSKGVVFFGEGAVGVQWLGVSREIDAVAPSQS